MYKSSALKSQWLSEHDVRKLTKNIAEKGAVLIESEPFFCYKCNEINTFFNGLQRTTLSCLLIRLLIFLNIICQVPNRNICPLYWFRCYTEQHMPLTRRRKAYTRCSPKQWAYCTFLWKIKCALFWHGCWHINQRLKNTYILVKHALRYVFFYICT